MPKNRSREGSSHIETYHPFLNHTESDNSKRTSQQEQNLPANQQNTAQFLAQSDSNYRRSIPQVNSGSNFASISKSNSAQGFTIIIKSPSQQNISYTQHPQSPQYAGYNGFSQQVRMIKNNSQPYLPSYPAYPAYPSTNFVPVQPLPFASSPFYPRPSYQPPPSNYQVGSPRSRPPLSNPFINSSPRVSPVG